jgi:anti-anti-sigma factor
MKIKNQPYNDVIVLELRGEMGGDSTDMFRQALSSATAEHKAGIVLDMSQVSFIDSDGLEQLLWSKEHCRENKCQLKLAALDETCAKILEITRLEKEFERYTELAEAVKSFA